VQFTSFPFFSGAPDEQFDMTMTGFVKAETYITSLPFFSVAPDEQFEMTQGLWRIFSIQSNNG